MSTIEGASRNNEAVDEEKRATPAAGELIELHAEAMFTQDDHNRLQKINEPWPSNNPAPRFVLTRSVEGTVISRFRHDVPSDIVAQIEMLCADEWHQSNIQAEPKHLTTYMNLLKTNTYSMGPCYSIPENLVPATDVALLTREHIQTLLYSDTESLISEIDYVQPCTALIRNGRAVSTCRSVRITSKAHEAGLETLEEFRGNGFAQTVVAAWAAAVRQMNCIPLYSTLQENLASQAVARKAGLRLYGFNFTVN